MKILTLCVLLPGIGAVQETRKPNIVLILADDLGAECLNSYGGTTYKTPNLDALARSGVRFDNCFVTPICSPTRVQLMTGRYGFRTGWTRLIDAGRDESFDFRKERTFGHVLKAAGYATGLAGKWQLAQFEKHPDHVRDCGFDEYCCWSWQIDGKRTQRYWNPSLWQDGKPRPDLVGKYGPDLLCDFAIDFIRRHKDRPFFFYYPMVLVHNPFEPTPDSKVKGVADKNAVFADMVAYMDKLVGRVVAELDALKLRDDTLILFMGDNGTTRVVPSKAVDATVIGGKGTMLDTGSRVPFIASRPGSVPAGRVLADLVDASDILPTLCEVAGAPLPAGVTLDGRSIAAQLRGEKGNPREWVFVQLGKNRFVRDLRWKLHEDGRLFDIQADPGESKPVTTDDAVRKRLQQALDSLR